MDNLVTARGLQLDAPSPGDVVSVKIKPPAERKQKVSAAYTMPRLLAVNDIPDHENIHHYRVNAIWRVISANGSHAVVQGLTRPYASYREAWVIDHHLWFDAQELYEALVGADVQNEPAEP